MDYLVNESGLSDGFPPAEIDGSTTVFGSGPESDVVITSPYVSRSHFKIAKSSGNYVISDMSSTNGTSLIRSKTKEKETVTSTECLLEANDRIILTTGSGMDNIVFRFHTEGTIRVTTSERDDRSQFIFSPTEPTVEIRGKKITLTQREFEVLQFMDSRRGEWCSRGSLIKKAWPQDKYQIANKERSDEDMLNIPGQPENLQKLISDLRKKIELNPSNPELIQTLPNHGYRISIA